jgi:hypothetical protein
MAPVTVLILAPEVAADAGPLERVVDAAWTVLAERHRSGFLAAGAAFAIVRREPPDDTPFGARLRRLLEELRPKGGVVVVGAGAAPLATAADRRAFVAAAAAPRPEALANQRYSADIVAISRAAEALAGLPDLRTDNALPRWLADEAGIPVRDLRARRRLAMDADSPLDLLLIGGARGAPASLPAPAAEDAAPVLERLEALRDLAADPAAELLVAGRTSAADLRWLERRTARGRRVDRGARPAHGPRRHPVRPDQPPAPAEHPRRAPRPGRLGQPRPARRVAGRRRPPRLAGAAGPPPRCVGASLALHGGPVR